MAEIVNVTTKFNIYQPKVTYPRNRLRKLLNVPKQAASVQARLVTVNTNAAEVATKRAQEIFESKRVRTSTPPEREGRSTTMGRMSSAIQYVVPTKKDVLGTVRLNVAQLNAATLNTFKGGQVHYWKIQESGTRSTATVYRHVPDNSRPDYPGAMQSQVFGTNSFKGQVGRKITAGLAWSTDGKESVPPSSPNSGHNLWTIADQAQYRAAISAEAGKKTDAGRHNAARRLRRAFDQGMIINREIKGKHFIQGGTRDGFRSLKGRTIAEVRRLGFYNE